LSGEPLSISKGREPNELVTETVAKGLYGEPVQVVVVVVRQQDRVDRREGLEVRHRSNEPVGPGKADRGGSV
jgi:hypothetical protein